MPVKILINGYFRSGTTAVWAAFKKANPDIVMLYEPCHERLPLILDVGEPGDDALHGRSLWSEYSTLKIDSADIRKFHCNIGHVYPSRLSDLLRYVEYFNTFDDAVGLQTNRWHEFIGDIGNFFEIPVVHVVRNPFDVYASFRESVYKNSNAIGKLKGWIKENVLSEDYFYVNEVFDFTKKRSALGEAGYRGPMRNINLRMYSHFERFLYCWVFYNYYALRECKKSGGLFISYESLCNDALGRYLNEYGMNVDVALFKIRRDSFINSDEYLKLEDVLRRMGVLNLFQLICDELAQ